MTRQGDHKMEYRQDNTQARKRWIRMGVLALAFLIGGFVLGQAAGAGSPAVPGSESDPLVTASWVEEKMDALFTAIKEEKEEREKLEDRMKQVEEEGVERPAPDPAEDPPLPSSPLYEVHEVPAGRKVLTGQGTEIIVRTGRVEAIEGPKGGLSDVTAGRNLGTGDTVERDHLILSPRDDGRGLKVNSNAYIMIRGDYSIE